MADADFCIRSMTRAEVDLAIDWAASEGWNPGLFDAEPYWAADPGGFLVGLLDTQPVAILSAIRHGDDFGFLGFYIVRPDRRGQGLGWRIWQAGLARLAGRNIGLDGVPAQQDNYRRSGFRLAHRNVRYQGMAGTGAGRLHAGMDLVPLGALPFDELAAYDRAFFPADRQAFLRAWITQPHSTALGLRQGGRLAGYGVVRACRVGHKIGPLFADTPAGAETLFDALGRSVPTGAAVFLDVPQCNPAALALAEGHAMAPVFETARMYTGPAPELALARTYGITSFELG